MANVTAKALIAGNWKMNKTVDEAIALAKGLAEGVKSDLAGQDLPGIVLCPTFVCLPAVLDALKGTALAVGAQNMDHRDSGAFTGEIAPPMLTALGVSHVIIGHSERRQLFGETNQSVNLKVKAALAHKLTPIMCVGETLDQRDQNITDDVIKQQVKEGLDGVSEAEAAKLVIAYEPVWAIGTGKNCENGEANRVCKMIRDYVNSLYAGGTVANGISILYGGSVKASTIEEQMAQSDIDGALVGGAALKVEEFLPIIKGGAARQKKMAAAAK
jgi:triosephosphate isomerase